MKLVEAGAEAADALIDAIQAGTQEDATANKSGAEVHTFDVIFEVLTQEQWTELLRAALEGAAAKDNIQLAQRLIGAGAEAGDALDDAVEGGHGEIMRGFLESGASLTAKDVCGFTPPLHVAALQGETEMVKLLALKGADNDVFDKMERVLLCLAVHKGHLLATGFGGRCRRQRSISATYIAAFKDMLVD